jgi:hypothetical protein
MVCVLQKIALMYQLEPIEVMSESI